jgi:hypothetical protein
LRWATKSTRKLAAELTDQGHPVSATKVRELLDSLNYSLQGTAKTRTSLGERKSSNGKSSL